MAAGGRVRNSERGQSLKVGLRRTVVTVTTHCQSKFAKLQFHWRAKCRSAQIRRSFENISKILPTETSLNYAGRKVLKISRCAKRS